MTGPGLIVLRTPETATVAPGRTEPDSAPAPPARLSNRAAGRLRARRRAALDAPEDVGLDETHAVRTAEDDADLSRASRPVTVASTRIAGARPVRPVARADVGLATTRAGRTAQDDAEARAGSAPITVPVRRVGPADGPTAGGPGGARGDTALTAGRERAGSATAATAIPGTGPAPSSGTPVTAHGHPLVDATVPTTPAEIRARTGAAVAGLVRPALPAPSVTRAPLDEVRADADARGAARTRAARLAPAAVVGRSPQPGQQAPREDPGPIHTQIEAIRAKSGIALAAATLPAVSRSPRGTLPDVTGPVLSADQLRILRLGEPAISLTDPSEQAQLRALRVQLTTTSTAPAPDVATGTAPPTSAPITDVPVAGVTVTPQQRAMFTQAVGELMRDPATAAHTILVGIRTGLAAFPGGVLNREFPTIGADEEKGLAEAILGRTRELGDALRLAPQDVQAATAQRTADLAAQQQAAAQARADAAAGATDAAQRRADAAHRTAAATAARVDTAVRTDARAAQGHRPDPIRARVDRTLDQIRDLVSTGTAAYDTQQRNRERAISDAIARQAAAYRFAQTRDEIALGRSAQAAEVRRWADAAVAALQDGPQSAKDLLVAGAQAETRRRQQELSDAGGAAFQALHDWGARQSSATQTWWTTLDTELQGWATDATARATQWKTVQGEQTRLALTQDLAAVQHVVELEQAKDHAGAQAYVRTLDTETQAVIVALGGGGDLAGVLAAGVYERVRAALRPDIETRLALAVNDLSVTADNRVQIDNLVAAMQSGPSILDRAIDIHASVTRWRGFDEGKIFRALTGMTPLGSKLLGVVYYETFDQTLEDALAGHGHVGCLSDEEKETARDLMAGNVVAGGAGALRSAIQGLGTDLDEVRRVLRTLSPEQRAQALQIYRSKYGETLTESLSDEWISHSETEETTALAAGDLRGADAIVLGRAVVEVQQDGYAGEGAPPSTGDRYVAIDRSGASAVYDGIRKEVEAEGDRQHWTTAQIEGEITLRNQETESAFDSRYADRWWAQAAPGQSALRTAFSHDSPAGGQLLTALANNDRTAADVARLRIEDAGVYAEDAAINAVLRDQHARALAEVNRDLGPVLNARVDQQLEQQERTQPFATGADRQNARLGLEHANAQTINRVADDRTRALTDALDTGYQKSSGRNLAAMVEDNMSGWSRREARAYVEGHGVLTDYQRIRYSIKGVGTDLAMLRQTLSTMSADDITAADARWRADNDGESLLEAVQGDTSGRDEGDLTDLVVNGAPQTVEEQAAAVRRRFERDRADERSPGMLLLVDPGLAISGGESIGATLTRSETAAARREVQRMEADLARLHRRDLTRDQQLSASAHFDITRANAETAIEFQRNAVDAWADLLSTAAAIIAAVVVGIALAPFTAGGSGVVAAAVITSLVATGVSMVTKALVKGGAYGAEEVMTDLAVGAVDAMASALTAGLAHGLLGRVTEAALPAGRSAILQGAERIGRSGAVSGAKSGFGGFMARFGSRGPLAAAVEGRGGLLATMAAESSPLYQRLAARGAAHLIEQTVQTLPSQFAASMLDERTWRDPGGAMRVLRGTAEGTVHSLGMGLAVGGALHLVTGAIARLRGTAPTPHLPADDVLTRIGTPEERLREFGAWQRKNPDGRYSDFYAERQERAIADVAMTDADRARVRAARRELLAGLDPAQRGGYADVPILLAGEGEFREHGGSPDAAAHLLIEDGQAILLLRDGAPPSALAGMLPTIQERVFAGSGGLTLEGALPPGVRGDVTVRRVPGLTTDTVRVVPIPPTGPITRIEVQVGPSARPIDVALHAGEVERVRGWTGLVGDARMLAARVARAVNLDLVSPLDRARFEAAGEVGKLGAVIEERVRRWVAAGDDVPGARRIEAEIRDQIAQLDRARRILSGELVAEPRGFVAAEGLPETPPEAVGDAAPPPDRLLDLLRGRREVGQLREQLGGARRELADAQAGRAVDQAGRDVIVRMQDVFRSAGRAVDLRPLEGLDLRRLSPTDLASRSAQRKLARFADVNRRYLPHDFPAALARLEAARVREGAFRTELPAEIVRLEGERTAAEARLAQVEALDKPFNGVSMSSQLPDPVAGWGYRVEDIRGDTAAQRESHRRGFQGELSLANALQTNRLPAVGDTHVTGRQRVVAWGHKVTEHGADVISVDEAGAVYLWDSKYLGSGGRHPGSATFSEPGPRANAIREAIVAVGRSNLAPAAKAQALANIRNGNFTAITISFDGRRFHSPVAQEFRGGREAP